MVVITSKYLKPVEIIDALLLDHRNFLDAYFKQKKFICSGPQNPRTGGVIIANVSIEEAREIMKRDPFVLNGVAEYQFIEFIPGKYDEQFSCFVK
jgi:uncharacterized protein YciI